MTQPSSNIVHNTPVSVQNMVQTMQRDRHTQNTRELSPSDEQSGLVKSRSFNDLHTVEDGWVSLDPQMLKKLQVLPSPQGLPSPGKPPKPPARRKKVLAPVKSIDDEKEDIKKTPLSSRPLPPKPDEERRIVFGPPKTDDVKRLSPKMPPKVPKIPYPATQNGTQSTSSSIAATTTTTNTSTPAKVMAARTIGAKVPVL